MKILKAIIFLAAALSLCPSCNPGEVDRAAEVVHYYYDDVPNQVKFTVATNKPIESSSEPTTIWAEGELARQDPPSGGGGIVSNAKYSVLEGTVRGYFSDRYDHCPNEGSEDQPFDKNSRESLFLRIMAFGTDINGEISIEGAAPTPIRFDNFINGLERGHLLIGRFGPGFTRSIVISLYSDPPIPG